jgi:hypothetical protein
MATRPTAGWDLFFDESSQRVAIIKSFEDNRDGDTEDISGLADTVGGVIRRKGAPVDVGTQITVSGLPNDEAPGYPAFKAAMQSRSQNVVLKFLKNGEGIAYTGHAENYSEGADRGANSWTFNLTFYVNSEDDVNGS